MTSNDQLNTELESFRQQWLTDLRSRNESSTSGPVSSAEAHHHLKQAQASGRPPVSSPTKKHIPLDDDQDFFQGRSFDELPAATGHTLAGPSKKPSKELVSALDHFEEAMEREAQGNMGESLKLYRKAYKLDNGVDRRYREKHFPHGHHKPPTAPSTTNPSQPPTTTAETTDQPQPQSINDLLSSFSSLSIQPTPPEVEGMPQPPCPISEVPDELLTHILLDVAAHDVAEYARLSLVCRRLAYLVSTEQRIWRHVSLSSKFGFAGMHHHFPVHVEWTALEDEEEEQDDGTLLSMRELQARRVAESHAVTLSLVPTASYPTWKTLFYRRPRIRFNGCYISTVNYVRTGQASTNQATWGGSPIHIVTYYRYLRFYRDGSVISLLTTSEPSDVVHQLNKDMVHYHRGDREKGHATSVLPSAFMHLALKGRWRLSSAMDHPEAETIEDEEGDVFIETEGVGPKYMYRMDLTLRSAGKGARNNKLIWKGFYSYNKLTDDWGEFGLKNDKPFFFSRVKSYGFGE